MSNLPPPPQSQSQPQPPETPPWDTPSSKWFSPISTPWRTTPRSTQSTPTPATPVALTEVVVSKSPFSQKSPATPKHDGIESEPLNDTMILLRLRTSRTNPWIWCGAALCFIFSVLLIIFGIATLILFLAVRPRTPVFDISNAKLNTIYFQSPVYFNGDMLLLLNFTNPNKKLAVRFDNLSVELWFSNKKIASQGVMPFSQRNGKTRLEPIRLISNLVFLRYSYWLHGTCQLQLASPPTGGLVSRNWAGVFGMIERERERESMRNPLSSSSCKHVNLCLFTKIFPWKESETTRKLKCDTKHLQLLLFSNSPFAPASVPESESRTTFFINILIGAIFTHPSFPGKLQGLLLHHFSMLRNQLSLDGIKVKLCCNPS